MPTTAHAIRLLLVESFRTLSPKVETILHGKSTSRLFEIHSVQNLRDAFKEIDKENFDLILMEADPADDPDFSQAARLHHYAPQCPVVALIAGENQPSALQVLQSGAHAYLMENQISETMLPAFLLRTIERAAHQKALRESEEHFRLLIENASDVILILDQSSLISYASPSSKRLINFSPDELQGQHLTDFLHRDDRRPFLDLFEPSFSENSLFFHQFRIRNPDNEFIHMEAKGRVILNPAGQRICILNAHDITHRVKLEEELRALSLRDELTGLHNRRSFVTTFEQQLKIAKRTNKIGFHLLFIDLDGFKWINDNLGHKVGDQALIQAAKLLKSTFREADVIARLGGDEFVIFLTDGSEGDHIDMLKKRLTDSVEAWNNAEKRDYKLAMSVGAVHHDFKTPRPAEEILREADELMFEQKRGKKRGAPPVGMKT